MVVGKRRDYTGDINTPHNVSFVFLGSADARSVNALVSTHMAGSVAAAVWVLMDYYRTRKWSVISLCTGAIAGLATITPGSGFVSPSSALVFGALGSAICNMAMKYKHAYGFDDALDVFAVHYVGGLVGLLLTGVFAQKSVIALSYPENTPWESIPNGGWLDRNWIQVPVQLAAIAAVSAWSFVITYIILVVINKVPFLRLRVDDEAEVMGTDLAEMGERAYGYLAFDMAASGIPIAKSPILNQGGVDPKPEQDLATVRPQS
ncbi:hypothetical protein EC973_002193 [Apophysomyces ossiformis]|uniref:Ammonium transporter AmtB-like domain-containing protein n=1 Tax=Apophysomyces ossiformis TaxID=679940 RepID=A0A8H7BXQ1_9FUNG|nr:hypothetical protein EC973_002193 [Apophysomyces ossiformis]